jgi:hypothetical protein
MPTKPDTSRQAPRWKPLSPAQEAALTLYLPVNYVTRNSTGLFKNARNSRP